MCRSDPLRASRKAARRGPNLQDLTSPGALTKIIPASMAVGMWRNWQTRSAQDAVDITSVEVQVLSSPPPSHSEEVRAEFTSR